MPVIKSAKKKLRKDIKRTEENKKFKSLLKKALKEAVKNPSEKNVKEATSMADKAVKRHLIHKNKAARIKSSLSKKQTRTIKKESPKAEKTLVKKKKITKK